MKEILAWISRPPSPWSLFRDLNVPDKASRQSKAATSQQVPTCLLPLRGCELLTCRKGSTRTGGAGLGEPLRSWAVTLAPERPPNGLSSLSWTRCHKSVWYAIPCELRWPFWGGGRAYSNAYSLLNAQRKGLRGFFSPLHHMTKHFCLHLRFP